MCKTCPDAWWVEVNGENRGIYMYFRHWPMWVPAAPIHWISTLLPQKESRDWFMVELISWILWIFTMFLTLALQGVSTYVAVVQLMNAPKIFVQRELKNTTNSQCYWLRKRIILQKYSFKPHSQTSNFWIVNVVKKN